MDQPTFRHLVILGVPVEGSGHVVLWNLANARVERLNQANLLAEDDEFDGEVDAKGFQTRMQINIIEWAE